LKLATNNTTAEKWNELCIYPGVPVGVSVMDRSGDDRPFAAHGITPVLFVLVLIKSSCCPIFGGL
jgi:hypothetical protein